MRTGSRELGAEGSRRKQKEASDGRNKLKNIVCAKVERNGRKKN